jgi:hypothetical protein
VTIVVYHDTWGRRQIFIRIVYLEGDFVFELHLHWLVSLVSIDVIVLPTR